MIETASCYYGNKYLRNTWNANYFLAFFLLGIT